MPIELTARDGSDDRQRAHWFLYDSPTRTTLFDA
jgi:hypothetical protein